MNFWRQKLEEGEDQTDGMNRINLFCF